jgi:hypothetical protein
MGHPGTKSSLVLGECQTAWIQISFLSPGCATLASPAPLLSLGYACEVGHTQLAGCAWMWAGPGALGSSEDDVFSFLSGWGLNLGPHT